MGEVRATCCVCGRSLEDPVSIRAGMGKICSGRAKRGYHPEIFRSVYTHAFVGGCLVIEDQGGDKSVTNDMEHVLRELHEAYGKQLPRLIVYRDSTGRWDGVRHRDGAFGGFIGLGVKDEKQAIKKLVALRLGRKEQDNGHEKEGRIAAAKPAAKGAKPGGGRGVRGRGPEQISADGARRKNAAPEADRRAGRVGSTRAR